ncbi:MAG: hydantoinase/oxoprolinase family protein [Steroidobacteraceae bacterium]
MIGVDVGGTFTDVVAWREGRLHVTKVPSVPSDPQQAVLEGARRLGVADAVIFNHASTKGLNAVLTRSLPKIGFLTTDGHRDMLDAGRAWRPFEGQLDARWRRPFGDAARPLVPRYLRRGVRERVLADGAVLRPLDEADARAQLELLKRCRVDGVAICLLNAYVEPRHEQRLAELAREVLGDIPLSVSSEASPRAREFTRAITTVVDVMMKLMYGDYAERLHAGLAAQGFRGALNFADCAASLLPWRDALEAPYRILFAGPAAGAASCRELGRALGEPDLVCCDVGGTSTDVALIVAGESFTNDSFEIEHDLTISALATEVASVGAGGGSLVSISPAGDVRVGPASAGAHPGPACYGRGGTQPTVTDACLLMGILDPHGFAGGQMELDAAAARRAFAALDTPLPPEQRVAQAYRIAVNNIAEEIANVTIRHGADPRDFSLVAYGAAGPMLLPAALEQLGLKRVIVPPHPGLFSALGLLSAELVHADSRSAYLMLEPSAAPRIAALFEAMERKLLARLDPAARAGATLRRSFDARIAGQSWETAFVGIPPGPIDAGYVALMLEAFHAEYARRNGQDFRGMPVQGVNWRVQLLQSADRFRYAPQPLPREAAAPAPRARRTLHQLAGKPVEAAIHDRESLAIGARVAGPAIIHEALCTTLVPPGHVARVGSCGELSIALAGAGA